MLKLFTPLLISSTFLTHINVNATTAAPLLLAGEDCENAVTVTPGTYTAPNPDYWYVYTAEATGTYVINTCFADNACDTRIYLYDHCDGLIPTELAEGTFSYNDDYCGTRSQVTTLLNEGTLVYIRIGDAETACAGQELIWSLTYAGEPEGCTDTYACNWSPIAMIDDGSCIYAGNPDCPSGPDLVLDATYLDGDIGAGWGDDFQLALMNADDWTNECYIDEGSLTGYGMRTIVKFGIKIDNQGDEDYHIGTPDESPFLEFDPCHGHTHYVDYGEYLLYDSVGNEIPVGHKNGFAVMDLCGIGGGYNGFNMGISAGCYDIYGLGTGGQWIDITDVPNGTYTFVARVNWDNHPDIDGRTETSLSNNWRSRCMKITRDVDSVIAVEMLEDCPTFIDCLGEIWGPSKLDCEGICNGWHHVGDLNADSSRQYDDVSLYINNILDNTILADICNDANNDSGIDVVDAALVMGCANESLGYTHDEELCELPVTMFNTLDTITLSIGSVNDAFNYLDIYTLNPTARILAAQFEMEGITIDSVQNLCPETFGQNFQITHTDDEVIALGYNEVPFQKHLAPIPTFRIFYSTTYPAEVCIKHVTAAVNENFEEIFTKMEDNCVSIDITGVVNFDRDMLNVTIQPNPFSNTAVLQFDNPLHQQFTLELSDMHGNLIRSYQVQNNEITIDRSNMAAGMYIYQLTGESAIQSGKFIIQ